MGGVVPRSSTWEAGFRLGVRARLRNLTDMAEVKEAPIDYPGRLRRSVERDDPALTGFDTSVVLVHRPGKIVGVPLEAEFQSPLEEVAYVLVQGALILLHSKQIVGLCLDDLPGDLLLAAHGVDGDDVLATSESGTLS